jgi:hypothetical protein
VWAKVNTIEFLCLSDIRLIKAQEL